MALAKLSISKMTVVPPSTNNPISLLSLAHTSPSPPQNDYNDYNEHSSLSPPGVNANDSKNDSNSRAALSEDTAKDNQKYNERGK